MKNLNMTERIDTPFSGSAKTDLSSKTPVDLLAELRPITGYEEEFIEKFHDQINTSRLCNEVLARCLEQPGHPPDQTTLDRISDLIVAERDRAIVHLRRISFGDVVNTEITCPECGKVSDISFDLNILPLNFEPPPSSIEVKLENGDLLQLRIPTAGVQSELLDQDLETLAERRTFLLARSVARIGDRTGPFDLHDIRSLQSSDRLTLEKSLEESIPDLELGMDIECSECRASFTSPFEITSFFLLS